MDNLIDESHAFYSDSSDAGQPDNNHYSVKRCVTPWCGYCGYEFKIGDQLSVWNKPGDLFMLTSLSLDLKYKPSWKIEQKIAPDSKGPRKKLSFCACGLSGISQCRYWYDASQPACHQVCHDLREATQRDYPTLFDYFQVRRPSFKPVRSDSARRCAFMEDDLVLVLGESIPNLPRETLNHIAEYSLYEHAITQLTTHIGDQRLKSSTINLRKNVWVEYILFEGQKYIREIFNETDGAFVKLSSAELIFNVEGGDSTDTMIVEMAPLGVRRVIFSNGSPRQRIEEEPDIWWKVMKFQDEPTIIADTDGVKLREVMFQSERRGDNSASIRDILWPTLANNRHYKLVSDLIQETSLYSDNDLRKRSRRMDSICLCSPGIYGLSFAIYNATISRPIIAIHTHLPGETRMFYREIESKVEGNVTWLYIPLELQEVVTEIWAKNAHENLPTLTVYDEQSGKRVPDLANLKPCEYWELLLVTNKGRIHQIGSARECPDQTWTLLHSSPRGLKRMFFENPDDTRYGSWSLGFSDEGSSHEPVTTRQLPNVLQNHSTGIPPHTLHDASMNCSGALLDDVIEVTPCLRKPNRYSTGTKTYISGLVLRYQDGHVARVGETRLEFVKPSQKVLDSSHVLRFTVWDDVLKDCTIGATQEDGVSQVEYIDIPLSGMLEWCFDAEEAWISHNEHQVFPSVE